MPVPAGGAPDVPPPTWAPDRSRVANYVPHRTLSRSLESTTASSDKYQFMFDATTTPTGVAVDRLVADGVAWVAARANPLNARLEDAAGVIAALYGAAAVERGWPSDDSSLQRANDLEKRMDALLADLVAANTDANTQDQGAGDYAIDVVPMYTFPPPPAWGDLLL